MIQWLWKRFINSADDQDEKIRSRIGTMASIVGMSCNILLFLIKGSLGLAVNSIAMVSDAFNNLSDSASNMITLLGYKMAAKPADKDHPFGHGRMEYLTSLLIAAIILIVGLELLRGSVDKIFHPEAVRFSVAALAALLLSVLVKLWMSRFYKQLGKRINSGILFAAAQDSLNDCVATAASALALILSLFTDLPADGIMGTLVSFFILYSGYGIIKDTVDELLGKPADKLLTQEIEKLILSNPAIIGIHDMIIHDYGPGKLLGSAHVEVSAAMDFMAAHDIVDELEREVYQRLKIMLTLHMDPVDTNDEQVKQGKMMMKEILNNIDPRLSFHDFRMVSGPTHTNLIFDIVVPYDCTLKNEEILNAVNAALKAKETTYYTVITFDRSYI